MKVSIIINYLFFSKNPISQHVGTVHLVQSSCKNCRFDKTKTQDPKAKNMTKTRESKTNSRRLETKTRVSITTSLHDIRLEHRTIRLYHRTQTITKNKSSTKAKSTQCRQRC